MHNLFAPFHRIAFWLLIGIQAFGQSLVAWEACPFGQIAVRGELLYLAPSFDETYFVINGSGEDGLGNPAPRGKRINNPVGYNFGFRLEGIYDFPHSCVDFRLRWTHLFATSRETVTNHDLIPQLWPTENVPGRTNILEPFSGQASSHIGLMYQKGEVLFDEKLCNLACCHFLIREGIEWSYIRYHEKVDYISLAGAHERVEFHGHTKGLGPQLGLIAFCEPCQCICWFPKNLSFKFMTTASLIAANSKAKLATIDVLNAVNKVTQSSFWRFVPELHYSVGINYGFCHIAFELGYEVTTYFRGTSKLIFDEADHKGHSFNQYSDFYVHGLFFACSLIY